MHAHKPRTETLAVHARRGLIIIVTASYNKGWSCTHLYSHKLANMPACDAFTINITYMMYKMYMYMYVCYSVLVMYYSLANSTEACTHMFNLDTRLWFTFMTVISSVAGVIFETDIDFQDSLLSKKKGYLQEVWSYCTLNLYIINLARERVMCLCNLVVYLPTELTTLLYE